MTITPDHAKTLLDGATPGPWRWGTNPRATLVGPENWHILQCGALLHPEEPDQNLIAAAPDLARTVIDQAEQIEKMRSTVAAFINKRPEYITALENSPEPDADYMRWQGHAGARRQLAHELGWTVPHNRGETTSQEADQ